MHKQDLVKKIASKTDLDEKASQYVLNLILNEVAVNLKRGKRVTLTGFGTFEVRRRKKRTFKSFGGQIFTVPAHKAIGFIVGRPLKRLIKGK